MISAHLCRREFLTTALQECALGRVLGSRDGGLVRARRLGVAAKAPEEIRTNGVEQVVATEVEAIDDRQCRIRSLYLSHRDRAVEATTGLGVRARSWL